jgi:hypothetical protein
MSRCEVEVHSTTPSARGHEARSSVRFHRGEPALAWICLLRDARAQAVWRPISPPVWWIVIVTICSMAAPAATRFVTIGMPVVARDMPIIAFDMPVIVLDAPAAPVVAISAARVITLDALATRLIAFSVPATWFLALAGATRLVALDALATGFLAFDALATRFLAFDALATRFIALDALAAGLLAFAALATRFIALDAKATRLVMLSPEATRLITLVMLWLFGTSVVRCSRQVVFVGLRYVASDQSLNAIESLTKLALDAIKLTAKRLDLTLQSGG